MKFAKADTQSKTGTGIYSMPLQSVYVRELKWAKKWSHIGAKNALQSAYIGELKFKR